MDSVRYRLLQRCLTVFLLVAVLLRGAGWLNRNRLPECETIRQELFQSPRQVATQSARFEIAYRKKRYAVQPVAGYELWGLVVSHNDPSGFGDIYHDRDSLDTRDLGVIWGSNLLLNDYREAAFWSTSWTLHCRVRAGLHLSGNELSNNHLITSSAEIRRKISRVSVGDQIHIKGMLVNYADCRAAGQWRNSSTVRGDNGNGACEVVYVEEIEVLERQSRLWRWCYRGSVWLFVGVVVSKVGAFLVDTRRLQHQKRGARG